LLALEKNLTVYYYRDGSGLFAPKSPYLWFFVTIVSFRVIKDTCYQAGLDERKVILLVDDEMSKDPKCMDDVCSLMRDGKKFEFKLLIEQIHLVHYFVF